jgi:membrane protein
MPTRLRRVGAGFVHGVQGIAGGLYRHDCLGLAAQVAYSALFSLFPFLLFLQALASYIPATSHLTDWLLGGLKDLVGTDSRLYKIVREDVFAGVSATSATLLSIGIILTLWSASGAVMVLIKAVNRAYGVEETRSWYRRRIMSVVLAVAGAVLIPAGVLLLVFGSWIGDQIGRRVGYASTLHALWVGFRWPVVFVLLVGVLGAFFYLAPSARQRWFGVLPGALFAVGAIIGASAGLSWFVSQSVMQVRWLAYGAIGTVIVLVFWAFLVGLMVLVGGEINAAIGRAVAGRRAASGGLVESGHDE